MKSFFTRHKMKKFYKKCSKNLPSIMLILSNMSYLYSIEEINNNFSTYSRFHTFLKKMVELTNDLISMDSIHNIDYRYADIVANFANRNDEINYLDCESHMKTISIDKAKKLVPLSSSAKIINPAIGMTTEGYCEHLAVHTALMNKYNACIEFFNHLYVERVG